MDLLLVFMLLLLVLTQRNSGRLQTKCPPTLKQQDRGNPWNYYGPGDHIISVVQTATKPLLEPLQFNGARYISSLIRDPNLPEMLPFILPIQVINKNTQLLQNLTLGYNIHDNYLSTLHTSDALMDMLSTGEANVPNYSCGASDNLLAVIDGAFREVSMQMSTLVGTYKVPQITCRFVSEALSDKTQFPFFFRMAPRNGVQYPAIVQLLLHFRWTLIGLFASDTEQGENFMRTFTPTLVRNGICVVISQQLSMTRHAAPLKNAISKWRQVNVFVFFTDYSSMMDGIHQVHFTLDGLPCPTEGKVWIITLFGDLPMKSHRVYEYVHSIWNFVIQERGYEDAFEPFIFVEPLHKCFHCSFAKHVFSVKGRRRCIQKAPLKTQDKSNRLQIDHRAYSVIKTLAYALNAAYSFRSGRRRKEGKEKLNIPKLHPWQLHPFLQKNEFCNLSEMKLYLDQHGDLVADMSILSWVVIPEEDCMEEHLGSFERQRLIINQDVLLLLKWLNKIQKNVPSVQMINIQMRIKSIVSQNLKHFCLMKNTCVLSWSLLPYFSS